MLNYLKLKWQQKLLRDRGYILVKNFLSEDVIRLYKSFCDLSYGANLRTHETSDYLVGDIHSISKNPFDDSVLLAYQPMAEKYFQRKMIPSYIFTREYFDGSYLKIHNDRPQCQYSISITVHKDPVVQSSLIFYDDEQGTNPVKIDMEEGDAIFFNGSLTYNGRWHSRPKVVGGSVVTSFLHYVDIDNTESAQEPFPLPVYRK